MDSVLPLKAIPAATEYALVMSFALTLIELRFCVARRELLPAFTSEKSISALTLPPRVLRFTAEPSPAVPDLARPPEKKMLKLSARADTLTLFPALICELFLITERILWLLSNTFTAPVAARLKNEEEAPSAAPPAACTPFPPSPPSRSLMA